MKFIKPLVTTLAKISPESLLLTAFVEIFRSPLFRGLTVAYLICQKRFGPNRL